MQSELHELITAADLYCSKFMFFQSNDRYVIVSAVVVENVYL